jgi:hypothetical protein
MQIDPFASLRSSLRLRPLPVLLAVVLIAIAPTSNADSKLPAWLRKKPEPAAAAASSAQTAPPSAATGADAPGAANESLLSTRTDTDLLELFNKGSLSGAELATELAAIQQHVKRTRSPRATQAFLGEAADAGESAGGGSKVALASLLGPKFDKFDPREFEHKVKDYTASIGYKALDLFLTELLKGELLPKQSISLKTAGSPKKLTVRQQQRVVTMAALVIAMRVTNEVLSRAHRDYQGIETRYTQLIDRREKAAGVLYGVLLSGIKGQQGTAAGFEDFSKEDLLYLRDTVTRMPIREFSGDMAAQNLALRFLRKVDPEAFKEYALETSATVKETKNYIRTVAGAAAFGALLVAFVQQSMATLRERSPQEFLAAFPFAIYFVREMPDLMKAIWANSKGGVVELPSDKSRPRFRVTGADNKPSELAHAADVFSTMKRHGEPDTLFAEALFRSGGDGLIYKLFRCDRDGAGRLIDVAVPIPDRDQFAADFLSAGGQRYSFANAFERREEEAGDPRELSLGDDLLKEDQRRVARRREFAKLQNKVAEGYGNWNDEQLMGLVFANREGAAALATLQLGDLRVRPIPSAQSVFIYESLIDQCGQQFGGAGSGRRKP